MERIEIDGARLEVAHHAAPDGATPRAPIVFLHEGLGSVAMWRDWPALICRATGRAGWVYSRRGYGASDPVPDVRGAPAVAGGVRTGRLRPDYLHHEALAVLPALLKQLGLAQPVLLGHSDGASIALIHAACLPVTAAIAMAPHVMVEDVSIESIAQARDAFETGGLRERLARYHADVDCAFWQWNDIWLSPAFRGFDIRADCPRIGAPVLAIQGRDDPYGTLAQIERIDLPPAQIRRVVLDDCGHSPQRDRSGETVAEITEFLSRMA